MIYLAGPFFNEVQEASAWKLIALCKDHKIEYFAPIEQDSIKIKTPEQAQKVFDSNTKNIEECEIILAQLEWLMPEHHELRVVKNIGVQDSVSFLIESPPLNLPDTGTVFEMGAGFLAGKEIIGYMTKPQEKLNLMLAQSCDGFLKGWSQIEAYLASGCLKSCTVNRWVGEIQ